MRSVGARSASASSPLHHDSDPDWNLRITRRSASFMLSSAGRMSPVLARGPQLVPSASDGLVMQPVRPGNQSRQQQQDAVSKLDAQRKGQSMQEQDSAAAGGPAERIASRQLPIPGGAARHVPAEAKQPGQWKLPFPVAHHAVAAGEPILANAKRLRRDILTKLFVAANKGKGP